MEIQTKIRFPSSLSLDLNFEAKVFLKCISWINLAALIIKCILAAVILSSAIKQCKDNSMAFSIQILCVFSLYMWPFITLFLLSFVSFFPRQDFSVEICLNLLPSAYPTSLHHHKWLVYFLLYFFSHKPTYTQVLINP